MGGHDNTIYDFDAAILTHIPAELHVERTNFHIVDDYSQELRTTIQDIYNAPDFFHGLHLIEGVKESWQAMIDAGYDPRILSAPVSGNSMSIEGKRAALERDMVPEFGPSILDDARFDKDKWKYDGVALFDDRPTVGVNPESGEAPWEHILYGWAHLSEVPMSRAAFRLLSWYNSKDTIRILDTVQDLRGV